ncbi:MAG TPA: hypothetical protein VFE24_04295 [Pirellulales bacterium]|jgi:hypothetical protein|nr:hypothetical protein [Pirellulales bacterium]
MLKRALALSVLVTGMLLASGCSWNSCCLEENTHSDEWCEQGCPKDNCATGCKFRGNCAQNPFNDRFCLALENCNLMPWNWFRHCGDDNPRNQPCDSCAAGGGEGGGGGSCPNCQH